MSTQPLDTKMIQQASTVLRLVSNPLRLTILDALEQGEKSVGDLQTLLNRPQAIVSQQLKILREHRIVSARREGTRCIYRISHPVISQILKCVRSRGMHPDCATLSDTTKPLKNLKRRVS